VTLTVGTAVTLSASASAAPPASNGRIAFSDYNTNQIYAVNPGGGGLVQLTHLPANHGAQWPAWSPRGSRLVFTVVRTDLGSDDRGRIWVMDADGTHQHRLAADAAGFRDHAASYAPNGRWIVFQRCKPDDGVCAIWRMRADGTHKHALTPFRQGRNETNDFYPAVAPNGRRITFTRFAANGIVSQVYVMRADGSHPHAITPPKLEAYAPAWSADGRRIAFTVNSSRPHSDIYTMRPDGTRIRRLTATRFPNDSFEPAYSPRGNRIAFASDRRHPDGCCTDLFVMSADGTRQQLVHTGLTGVIQVTWGSASPRALPRTPGQCPDPIGTTVPTPASTSRAPATGTSTSRAPLSRRRPAPPRAWNQRSSSSDLASTLNQLAFP
jgi:Tol biopolymer transport system component